MFQSFQTRGERDTLTVGGVFLSAATFQFSVRSSQGALGGVVLLVKTHFAFG